MHVFFLSPGNCSKAKQENSSICINYKSWVKQVKPDYRTTILSDDGCSLDTAHIGTKHSLANRCVASWGRNVLQFWSFQLIPLIPQGCVLGHACRIKARLLSLLLSHFPLLYPFLHRWHLQLIPSAKHAGRWGSGRDWLPVFCVCWCAFLVSSMLTCRQPVLVSGVHGKTFKWSTRQSKQCHRMAFWTRKLLILFTKHTLMAVLSLSWNEKLGKIISVYAFCYSSCFSVRF